MIIYKKSAKSEPSKAAEQQPVNVQTTPSMAAASVPLPAARTGLTTCSNADARHATLWILQYVECLKDARHTTLWILQHFLLHCFWILALLLTSWFL
jgi:hypothetical protein